MLFNEPKLLKLTPECDIYEPPTPSFSALQRAEIAEIELNRPSGEAFVGVSVLFNEPKLLKFVCTMARRYGRVSVSVLFNEPKLLKSRPSLPALPVSQILIPARRRS